MIHRDIKPENVLLTAQGDALLADFGIARALAGGTTPAQGATGGLTVTGLAVGTPQYMSPEQASGERNLTTRSDIYALGAVCYEMLAGEPPFTGPTLQAVIARMMSSDAPSVRRLRPSVPEAVDVALRKALAPVPADRWATAGEFARALNVGDRAAASPRGVAALPVPAPKRRLPIASLTMGLGFLVGVGVLFAWRRHETDAAPPNSAAGPVGLAVLPFDSEGDTASGYFADGITDEIRGKLSALPALQVIARASSNEYRHTTKPADQIGRELGVQYLLTGTVQWERAAGGARRVRVSPELVQVSAGHAPVSKWQQSYDTTLADVFDVQSAVATRVADKLGVVLSPPAQTQLAARPTENLAAYDAYLRSGLQGNDPRSIRKALAAADQAVALDSTFAAAWARVSSYHTLLYTNSMATRADAEAARNGAERAIALAPTTADGYVARALYELTIAFDPAAARAAAETAIRLAPSSSDAMRRLANIEAAVGEWEPALAHARQAAALDPRATGSLDVLTRMLVWLRRYPEARAEAEQELQTLRQQLETKRLQCEVVLPAEAARKGAELLAQGAAAQQREQGLATAETTRAMAQALATAGSDAREMFVLSQLDTLVAKVAEKVKGVTVAEVQVIDGGDGRALPALAASFPAVVGSVFGTLRELTGVDVQSMLASAGNGGAR